MNFKTPLNNSAMDSFLRLCLALFLFSAFAFLISYFKKRANIKLLLFALSLIMMYYVIVLATEIEDRYGEYGLVGVAILKKSEDAKIWDIDTLLMSCRVLGRGADTAFLAQVIEAARQKGAQTVRGKYIPTPKNKMVEDLYKRHGFSSGAEEGEWTVCQEKIAVPEYINTTLSTC